MRFVVIAIIISVPVFLLGSLGWSLAVGVPERPIGPVLAPVNASATDIERGEALYRSKCYGCHAVEAHVGPSLTSAASVLRDAQGELLIAAVRGGRALMPAFSEDMLSDEELADIIAYIRSLK